MALKLPGKLGACYRQFLGRLAPWPRSFYSKVFQISGDAQPARSSQPPPSPPLTELENGSVPHNRTISHITLIEGPSEVTLIGTGAQVRPKI